MENNNLFNFTIHCMFFLFQSIPMYAIIYTYVIYIYIYICVCTSAVCEKSIHILTGRFSTLDTDNFFLHSTLI